MVDIVTLAEIRSETKFRPLKEAIFKIADNQIEVYNRLTNGVEEWESEMKMTRWTVDVDSDHSDTAIVGTEGEDVQDEDFTAPTAPKDPRVLKGYLFQLDQFKLLSEKFKVHGNFRLKFDLRMHGPWARTRNLRRILSDELQSWAMVPNLTGLNKYTLRNAGDSRMLLFILLLH